MLTRFLTKKTHTMSLSSFLLLVFAVSQSSLFASQGTYMLQFDATIHFNLIHSVHKYNTDTSDTTECPLGTTQIGGLGADIIGCGITNCANRYDLTTINECVLRCKSTQTCIAITWADIGGDHNHPNSTVCSMYDTDQQDNLLLDSNEIFSQLFCSLNATIIQPTTNKTLKSVCISGSTLLQSYINGEYIYHSWDNDNNGAIYYNLQANLFLFPWVYSGGRADYIIGFDKSINIGVSYCDLPLLSVPLTPYDCYNGNGQQLYTSSDIFDLWMYDENAILKECPGTVHLYQGR